MTVITRNTLGAAFAIALTACSGGDRWEGKGPPAPKPPAVTTPLPAWSTFQGNAAHTGYVPATFEVKNFSQRWTWQKPASAREHITLPVVTSGDTVFVVAASAFPSRLEWSVRAIDEQNGKERWQTRLGDASSATHPAAVDGKVFLTTIVGNASVLWTLDQRNGNVITQRQLTGSNAANPMGASAAPTPHLDGVYMAHGPNPGLSKILAATGAAAWTVNAGSYAIGWSPAVDSNNVYAPAGYGALLAYRLNDGREAWRIGTAGAFGTGTPVIDGNGMLFAPNASADVAGLDAFDLNARTLKWQRSNVNSPVVTAKGLVYYVFNGGLLGNGVVALDAVTGQERWSLGGTFGTGSRLLVSDNLLFVSDPSQTVAIDLTTRQIVWRHPRGGSLAVSERGVLYVLHGAGGADGIDAVSLR